jgi:hypothetical protein
MNSPLKVKPFPGVQKIGPEHIEKRAMEDELRAAQLALDVQLHDLRTEFLHREAKLRDEYLGRRDRRGGAVMKIKPIALAAIIAATTPALGYDPNCPTEISSCNSYTAPNHAELPLPRALGVPTASEILHVDHHPGRPDPCRDPAAFLKPSSSHPSRREKLRRTRRRRLTSAFIAA